jgi:S1-C subfamily serine protease
MKTGKILIGLSLLIVILLAATGGAVADRIFGVSFLDKIFPGKSIIDRKIVSEESVVIKVAEEASPSVVTVSVETPARRVLQLNPFGGFSSRVEGGTPQDIGTGFIVSSDGLIVTNKHVVSSEDEAKYKVITKDDKEYEVTQISKDPANDIAILKIDATGLKPVELGESSNLKVGQFVVAIGTALGEFRHTVTTGVISGLGRGITAGSVFEGYVERLDNVIQTDAAINPGNSGGPLLNSAGQVIGINVAIAQGAQNVGFAIPVDTLKSALSQYNSAGGFPSKAYLGVEYQMISQDAAQANSVPEGAYVVRVVAGSPAETGGIIAQDIMTKIDGEALTTENTLGDVMTKKKPGDTLKLDVWRNGQALSIEVGITAAPQ